ncbi:MAG: hypothetical protein HFI09_01590 [Bacilli bacterium]|nr:hypothetical protein [Bacilli bacterium]
MNKKNIVLKIILVILLITAIYLKNILNNTYGLKKTDKITITHYNYQNEQLENFIENVIIIDNKDEIKSLENSIRFTRLVNEEAGYACVFSPIYVIEYHNGFTISLESIYSTRVSFQDDKGHRGVMQFPLKYLQNIQKIMTKNS